jgi:hypothetical protein
MKFSARVSMFFKHAITKPYLTILVTAVTAGVAAGGFLAFRVLAVDPTIVLVNKQSNPYPWLNLPQETNLKLYAVSKKSTEKGVREHY